MRFLSLQNWQWISILLTLLVAWILGHILHRPIIAILVRSAQPRLNQYDEQSHKLLSSPVQWSVFSIVVFAAFSTFLAFPASTYSVLQPCLRTLLICSFTYLIVRLLRLATDAFGQPYNARLKEVDEIHARRFTTQVVLLRRLTIFALVAGAVAYSLLQFSAFRSIGMSFLASAGIVGIVLGLAAQRTLSNLLAGIQLVLTQPIRIGDSVFFENEWGWIEEITYTYVVIRIWDLRRLVVPINYLLERPIQNWTLNSPNLLGSVIIQADYRLPVEKLREELKRLCIANKLWDGKTCGTQVVDCNKETMEIRALCSSNSAGELFDLRCYVRENLVAFL